MTCACISLTHNGNEIALRLYPKDASMPRFDSKFIICMSVSIWPQFATWIVAIQVSQQKHKFVYCVKYGEVTNGAILFIIFFFARIGYLLFCGWKLECMKWVIIQPKKYIFFEDRNITLLVCALLTWFIDNI
jgi:hypothetical protein